MRCKNCPAYWEAANYEYGVEDCGCYCDPDEKYEVYEYANGDMGCHRKLSYIQKVMKQVKKSENLHYLLDSILHLKEKYNLLNEKNESSLKSLEWGIEMVLHNYDEYTKNWFEEVKNEEHCTN